jgi:DNA polymerase III delta prime subunit
MLMTMREDIKQEQSISSQNQIINNRIQCEMFYFNPIYGQLLAKRNQMIANNEEINEEELEQ